jgi:hypothetical protein
VLVFKCLDFLPLSDTNYHTSDSQYQWVADVIRPL